MHLSVTDQREISIMVTLSGDVELVVARYNESLSWIPDKWKPFTSVYNKGDALPADEYKHYKTYKPLPNVGRESHTYLTYIVDNYDQLPECIVFTQGNPFDHSKEFLINLDTLGRIDINKFKSLGHWNIEIHNMFPRYDPKIKGDLMRCYQKWIGEKIPHRFTFSAGAIFAVTKDAVRARTTNYYKDILSSLSNCSDPVEGYCLERLWGLIFTSL